MMLLLLPILVFLSFMSLLLLLLLGFSAERLVVLLHIYLR